MAPANPSSGLTDTDILVDAARKLPITEVISETAYQLIESFHLSHGLLLPDALIGATCLVHGLPLHTKNVRHFQMIAGLTVERPY